MFHFTEDEAANWGRFTFYADQQIIRKQFPVLWSMADPTKPDRRRERGSAAGSVLLVLAGITSSANKDPAVDGYRAAVPLTLDRGQRLGGFGSKEAVRAGLRRIAAAKLALYTPRAPRPVPGNSELRLRGQAQRLSLARFLFARRPADEAEKRDLEYLGRGPWVAYHGALFWRGHMAAIPAAARHLYLSLRSWEPVQDQRRYMAPLLARGEPERVARYAVIEAGRETAATHSEWAARAGMDVRTFRKALNVLQDAVITGGSPYISAHSDSSKAADPRWWFITTPLERILPPLSFDVLNRPLEDVAAARKALYGFD